MQLSGFVSSREDINRAIEVARGIGRREVGDEQNATQVMPGYQICRSNGGG